MKKLAFKLLFFIIFAYSADYILGSIIENKYLENEFHYSNGHLNYYLNEIDCDTLFIGSSRMLHHVRTPDFVGEVYNLSKARMNLGYQTALVDILNSKKKLPSKTLVVHVDMGEFFRTYETELIEDIYFLKYYYPRNEFIRAEVNKNSIFEPVKFQSKLYLFNGETSYFFTNPIQKIGFKPYYRGYHPLNRPLNESGIDTPDSIDFSSVTFKKYLLHIDSICTINKISLKFICSPQKDYDKKKTSCKQQFETIFSELNLNFINLWNDSILDEKLTTDSLWADEIHLNDSGAKLFTGELKKRLRNN